MGVGYDIVRFRRLEEGECITRTTKRTNSVAFFICTVRANFPLETKAKVK
jgi:hypothetical protein